MDESTNVAILGTLSDASHEKANREDLESAVLKSLNCLIVLLNLNHPRVSSLQHVSSDVYSALFEKIFGYKPLDLIGAPRSTEDEAHNVQCVIDTLSLDILGVSLSHITGEDIVSRKPLSIYHLLDLLNEFAAIRDMELGNSTSSVPLSVSSNSSLFTSDVSHQAHFCSACEYGLSKTCLSPAKVGHETSVKSVTHGKCSEHHLSQKNHKEVEDISRSCSSGHSAQPPRKRFRGELPFNELLAEKLLLKLEQLKNVPASVPDTENLQQPLCSSPLNDLYKSVFQKSASVRVVTPGKETSVLLPRYLRRRKTPTIKSKPTSSQKRKLPCSAHEGLSSTGGILEEIQCEVPGVHFTRDGLQNLGLIHQRQVKFLSSRLASLRRKMSASEKMLHENILREVQMSELEQKNLETKRRIMNTRNLRKEQMRTRGAMKNSEIQRARLKRYFDQYNQHKRKLASSQHVRGEMILQNLYKHRLALQKQEVNELSKDLRKQDKDEAKFLSDRIASVQNFYRGKSDLLKEHAEERVAQKESQMKAQCQELEQTRRAILKQIESEVKDIQQNLEQQDDFYFVEADAERLKEKWSKPR